MGAGWSDSRNSIHNSTSALVQTHMGAEVDASANLECKNIQQVSNVQGCNITFAPQTCTASATSLVTTNQSLDSTVTQSIFNDAIQLAESSNEGLIIGLQVSTSSNYVRNQTDIAIETVQSFKTDCTKNVSAVNAQIIEDSSCTEKNEIQFATQEISMEVFGDCVADQTGRSTSSQNIANITDQAARSSNKGIDLWAIVILGLLFLAMLLVLPIGIRIMTSGKKKYDPGENKVARFMTLTIFVMFLVWNLLFGYFLGFGIFPYRPIQRDGDGNLIALCRDGQSIDRDLTVNNFMWWDADCITAPEGVACNDTERQKHYATCGLFADNGCSDPEFTNARQKYIDVSKACASLNDKGRPVFCRPADVAVQWFDQTYSGCIKCNESEGANGALFGTFVNDSQIDPNLPVIPGLPPPPRMTCDINQIDPLAYAASQNIPCEAGSELPFCKGTTELLLAVSPWDCPNDAYQARKQWYSKGLRSCDEILANVIATPEPDGSPIPLAELCPPNVFEYFSKCNAGTRRCSYVAAGCVDCDPDGNNCDCSAADPFEVKSCTNDLTDCQDPEYLKDYDQWKAWDDKCKADWEQWHALNPAGTIYSLVFYAVAIIIVIVLFMIGGRKLKLAATGEGAEQLPQGTQDADAPEKKPGIAGLFQKKA